MKTVVIVNPKSANGETGKKWGELSAILSRHVSDFKVEFTRGPMDAARLAKAAIESGAECVAACGGDGTINEVVNGFFSNEKKVINPKVKLAILPRGTGGDFRKSFGWDSNFLHAAQRLSKGQSQALDVGRVDFVSHERKTETRFFANICSFGSSGLVDEEANKSSKFLGGKLSFAWASAKAMAKYRDQNVSVSFDGGPFESISVTTLAVCNGQYFGGGMKMAPDANTNDGFFDVTIWSGLNLKDFIIRNAGIYSGDHTKWKETRTLRCKEVIAKSHERVLIDCDGEQPGILECKLSLVPGAIQMVV
jgi:YegS/Rv2252/BmrU family lipid kinase